MVRLRITDKWQISFLKQFDFNLSANRGRRELVYHKGHFIYRTLRLPFILRSLTLVDISPHIRSIKAIYPSPSFVYFIRRLPLSTYYAENHVC